MLICVSLYANLYFKTACTEIGGGSGIQEYSTKFSTEPGWDKWSKTSRTSITFEALTLS